MYLESRDRVITDADGSTRGDVSSRRVGIRSSTSSCVGEPTEGERAAPLRQWLAEWRAGGRSIGPLRAGRVPECGRGGRLDDG